MDRSRLETLTGNKAFVDTLTDQDILVIQLYYRWITQRTAKNQGISTLLIKEASKTWLKEAYGADDWVFSGVVDYGASVLKCAWQGCGHPVRRGYYLSSPSTQKEIVFGSTCMSKFLGVDVSIINKIDSILSEVDIEMLGVLRYGKYSIELQKKPYFTILYALQTNTKLNTLFVNRAGKTAVELYLNFLKQGLLLPEKLDKLITDAITYAVDTVFWRAEYIEGFEGYDYIKYIPRDSYRSTIDTLYGSFTVVNAYIHLQLPMCCICQIPFNIVLACLTVNAYIYGMEFARKKVDIFDFMNKIGQIFCAVQNTKRTADSRNTAMKVCDYLITDEDMTPGAVIGNALLCGNTNDICVFFTIEKPEDILMVVLTHYDSVLRWLNETL